MTNSAIFISQVVSIFVFVGLMFGLYRLLVSQKDGVIELLKEQLREKEDKIEELEKQTPDALAKSLSDRVRVLLEELGRLKEDKEQHSLEIERKESELANVRNSLEELVNQIEQSDLICPECGSPLSRREFYPISGHVGGREIDADGEYVEYECGRAIRDGEVISHCGS